MEQAPQAEVKRHLCVIKIQNTPDSESPSGKSWNGFLIDRQGALYAIPFTNENRGRFVQAARELAVRSGFTVERVSEAKVPR